jgi:hypothetical protein
MVLLLLIRLSLLPFVWRENTRLHLFVSVPFASPVIIMLLLLLLSLPKCGFLQPRGPACWDFSMNAQQRCHKHTLHYHQTKENGKATAATTPVRDIVAHLTLCCYFSELSRCGRMKDKVLYALIGTL